MISDLIALPAEQAIVATRDGIAPRFNARSITLPPTVVKAAGRFAEMALIKVPEKALPWLLLLFGVLALVGLVGLMTDNHIWPFK